MDNSELILERLLTGGTLSGESLSRELGISRTAVWKHILALREDGWNIEASPRAGYHLAAGDDAVYPFVLSGMLNTARCGRSIRYYRETDSTNLRAREWAQTDAPDGALVLAEAQTAGRGRLGRVWRSPVGSGIYMSLILRSVLPLQRLARVMPVAPLGVRAGLQRFLPEEALIKWPNDIVCGGRKICGMLMELQAGADGVEWLIMGIGINVRQRTEDFPDELRATAASVDSLGGHGARAQLICAVLEELEHRIDLFLHDEDAELMREYRAHSATLGRRVRVISQTAEYEAQAEALCEDGALEVLKDSGERERVYAGDVSVRGIMGYV